MTKKEFVSAIKEACGEEYGFTNKEIEAMLKATDSVIMDAIRREDSVKFESIGTFKGVTKAAHEARNPATGGTVTVPEKKGYPMFKFSTTAKRTEG